MKKFSTLLISILVCGLASAAEQTEIITAETNILKLEKIRTPADGELWQRYLNAYDTRVERMFQRRFGTLNTMNLARMQGGDPERAQRRIQDRAADTLNDAASYSARDMAAGKLGTWIKNSESVAVKFLVGSLGQSEEEEVNPLDVGPESTMVEESLFSRLRKTHGISYGVRPFRTSPYGYVSARVTYDSEPIARVLVRYHFNHFNSHEFEGVISVPFGHIFSVHTGFSYEIESVHGLKAVVRLHARLWGGEIFVGGSGVGDAPFRGFAGYARAW